MDEVPKGVKPLPGGGSTGRPDMKPRKTGVLFHGTGSTGWGRIRRLGDYKGTRSETDFAHRHGRFFDPAVDPDPEDAA